MNLFSPYAYDLDEAHIKAERRRARELRGSQWWKRRCAKGFCHYCGQPTLPKELTMDHIVPIARGGKSTKGNIVPACKACNNKKKQLLPMEWQAYLEDHHRSSRNILPTTVNEENGMKDGPTLTDLGTGKSQIHSIIHALSNGVMVTDAGGRVVLINPTFIEQMDLPRDTVPGLPLEAYISDGGLRHLVTEISRGRQAALGNVAPYEFSVGNEKYLQARIRTVVGVEQECLGAAVTLEDITAMKVLDRLKREFVAKVSHELRSPLSTIHELLAAVLSDIVGQVSSTDEHLLSRAKEKTQGLIALIGDLLDLSRIESGAVCEAPKPVILEDLLENIIDFLGTRAAAKHQDLVLDRPKEPLPAVKADPLALESIFGNLITNAINYTPDNGKIEVRVRLSGSNIQVQVIDNGFGIEARHLDKIFERFYRVKTEKTRYITGTGLGLPIVKGLVDSLAGHISVESTADRGSTFTVLLPTVSG
jgi:two-component system phosphate regulon sensor histidine kinase PhoR